MKRLVTVSALLALLMANACSKRASTAPERQAKAFGAAVAVISGDKQMAGVGSQLEQPLVVQINDAKGTAVSGALVRFSGPAGMAFTPDHALSGSDGQVSTTVTLGSVHGRYQIKASTRDQSGKSNGIGIDEVALGYQETLGRMLSETHCVRCHENESTAERVSNHDNLSAAPHSLSDGSVVNKMTDANLAAIIGHGGTALGKSPEMPPYAGTLNKAEIDALIALIRAIADPPYRPQGVLYAVD